MYARETQGTVYFAWRKASSRAIAAVHAVAVDYSVRSLISNRGRMHRKQ
jgi:hypothetical protein